MVLNRELRSYGESTAARVPSSARRRAQAQRLRRVAHTPLALAPSDRRLRADFLAICAQERSFGELQPLVPRSGGCGQYQEPFAPGARGAGRAPEEDGISGPLLG